MSPSIIAAGCVFPSGPTLALADIAIRTQLSLVHKHLFCVDRCGIPIKASFFPQSALPFDATRWQALAENALLDALPHAAAYAALPSRLWLILPPSDRPGVPSSVEDKVATTLLTRLTACLETIVLRGGHAEAGNALLQVCQKQQHDTTLTLDIVVAVDSWLASESLMWLEMQHLLHGSHTLYRGEARANPYGRIPGEGAAALILAPTNKLPAWVICVGSRQDWRPYYVMMISHVLVWASARQCGREWFRLASPSFHILSVI
ncbi:hypothetical protein ACSPAB_03955 [Buttiauxella agrestis]